MKNHSHPDSGRKYDYETPMWAVAILCSLAVVFFFLCVIAFTKWLHDEPIFVKWFVLLIGIGFLTAGIRPRNWKPWRYFYADNEGIHFPSECPETKGTTWLLVPWDRVGSIKEDVFYGGHQGLSIELLLQDGEIHRFFRNLKLTKMFFGQEVRENGYFNVGYRNAFKSIDTAVSILNEFKQRHT